MRSIEETADNRVRGNQARFRKTQSCVDQIATLFIIIEQSQEWNSSLSVNFIGYEKAFDGVDQEILWKLMRHYVIPDKIVKFLRATHYEVQLSQPFQVQ